MKKNLLSMLAMAVLMAFAAAGYAQTTYTRINSAAELEAGEQYLIVGYDEALGYCAMSYQKTSNRHAIQVAENGGSITVTPATDPNSQTEVFELTLGGSNGAWTFFDELKGGYLYASSSSANQLKTQTTLDDNGKWNIEFNADGTAVVVAQGENTRNYMRFNENSSNGDPLFNCYKVDAQIQVPVAFYKAGGAPVINPEPSNYPTSFAPAVIGTDVVITWNDATGAQLPSKYLVVASTGSIPVPSDGTPVENSELAKNVNYGIQTVTFTGLESNTTYNFAIFPYTNSGANIDYKTDGNYPTAHVTTANIEVLLDENFDDGLGMFTTESITGEQEWHQSTYNSITYAGINGYVSGSAHENEDWLISPEIPFSRDNIALEFRTAMKFPDNNPLRVMVSCDYPSGAPVLDGYWEDITYLFEFSTGNYEWVESGQVSISDYLTNQLGFFHIAFVYNSTDEAAASWEIDYVKVVKGEALSVEEEQLSAFNVYPNPANNVISFNLESDAQVSIFDVTGRMVSTMSMAAGQGQCQVGDLETGVYFLNVRYANGKQEVARFVKF